MNLSTSILLLPAVLLTACQVKKPTVRTEEPMRIVSTAAQARIDRVLEQFVTDEDVVGVSALVYERGEEVYFGAFGLADREAGTPMDRNTIVQIFSMTKPITGVALMQLYEQGKFLMDDPLSMYAPEFGPVQVFTGVDEAGQPVLEAVNRPILIRDITRHTAGFATDASAPGLGPLLAEADPGNINHTLPEFAERLASVPLAFQPGTQWLYGPSVDVQAYLVEKLSGQPFDAYIREHIFAPLGMTQTRYYVPEEDRSRLAAVYQRFASGALMRIPDEQMRAFNTKHWPLTPGGWGLTATIDDYMTFARMLVNQGQGAEATLLRPETVRQMASNHLDDSITERIWLPSKGQVGFGIDFAVRLRPPATPEENYGTVGEFFWDGAASTLFWVDPVNELTAVLFVQLFPFDQIGLHRAFRDAVYSEVSGRLPSRN